MVYFISLANDTAKDVIVFCFRNARKRNTSKAVLNY